MRKDNERINLQPKILAKQKQILSLPNKFFVDINNFAKNELFKCFQKIFMVLVRSNRKFQTFSIYFLLFEMVSNK